jgi:mannosyl-3-phosphoglycerate phosphatase
VIAVFTDLDNCLLDHDTYSFEPARPALLRLHAAGAIVVFVTSKTRAEVEYWHQRTGLTHPSIVENGGAVIREDGTPFVLGRPRSAILAALRIAAATVDAQIRTFSDMPLDELAARMSAPLERARLSAAREFSEPFVLLEPAREAALRSALEARGLTLTRGGRFHHALAHPGKHAAVAWLLAQWSAAHPPPVTIGLGDAPNDEGFLGLVQHPVRLAAGHTGPAAWNQAVLALLDRLAPQSA